VLNPWVSIWTKPRQTIAQIVATDPTKYVVALAAVSGVAQFLDRASSRNLGDRMSLTTIIAMALTVGPGLGVIFLYLLGALTKWTGGWLGGRASAEAIRAALAWSSVPFIMISVLWIPQLLLVGSELFTEATPRLEANAALALAILPMFVLQAAVSIWSLVLLCKCLGEVQGFSAWRGLGNAALAAMVIGVPVFALAIAAAQLGG
jgi:hypothetical protein